MFNELIFSFQQKNFNLGMFRFWCFGEISKFQDLGRYQEHCFIIKVTVLIILLSYWLYEDRIWS